VLREKALMERWAVPTTHHDRRYQDPDINTLNPYKRRTARRGDDLPT
jgi:hypothetical protein